MDPYLVLGYGVNAYMDIVLSFAKMFMVLTVSSIPLYIVYSSGKAYGPGTGL